MARKTIAMAAENLRGSTALIGERYRQGINGADWQGPASSDQAEQNWATGVQAAVADGSRRAGILAVTNAQWQTAAIEKGVPNIARGIIAGLDKYQRNFGPILSAMNAEAATLPPRTNSATQNVQTRLLPIIRSAQIAAGKQPS
mgnify:CR=1 FL=1